MNNFEQIYKDVIDYLAPSQTMYEQAVYHILLRKSHLQGTSEIRIGQRTLASIGPKPAKATTFNKGSEIKKSSQAQIKRTIESLANKGHIEVKNTTFAGTLYKVNLPREIPECLSRIREAELNQKSIISDNDFYNVPANRLKVYERDNYQCRYCGIKITPEDATLDHIKPVSQGGTHSLHNLVTACLKCNAIKGARDPNESLLEMLDRFKNTVRNRN